MIASRISMVKTALPAITSGCRALFDHLVGIGTLSGSSAARGLRGVVRRESARILPDEAAATEELEAADRRAANGSKIWLVVSAMHPTRCDFNQSEFRSPNSAFYHINLLSIVAFCRSPC
jgi:hypothetical protein